MNHVYHLIPVIHCRRIIHTAAAKTSIAQKSVIHYHFVRVRDFLSMEFALNFESTVSDICRFLIGFCRGAFGLNMDGGILVMFTDSIGQLRW